jgi:hypothetical protein
VLKMRTGQSPDGCPWWLITEQRCSASPAAKEVLVKVLISQILAMLEKFFPSSLPLDPEDDLQQVHALYVANHLANRLKSNSAHSCT